MTNNFSDYFEMLGFSSTLINRSTELIRQANIIFPVDITNCFIGENISPPNEFRHLWGFTKPIFLYFIILILHLNIKLLILRNPLPM